MRLGRRTVVNPDLMKVVFYVAGQTQVEEGSYINSSFYNLKDLKVKSKKSCNPVKMRGMFIASSIQGDKNVNWYSDTTNCGNCTTTGSARLANNDNQIDNALVTNASIRVETVPNPFRDKINIKFSSLVDDSQVKVVLYDLQGRLINTVFNGKIVAGENYDALLNGDGLGEGTYIYKIFTSTKIFTGKIVKLK